MESVIEFGCEIKLVLSVLDRKMGGREKIENQGIKYESIFEINSKESLFESKSFLKKNLDAIKSIASSVYDFHARWDLLDSDTSPYKLLSEREPLLQEEIKELIAEYNKDEQSRSITLLSREADVLYVSVGSMLALGNNGIEAMNQVSEKNNNKTSKKHIILNKSEKKSKKIRYLDFYLKRIVFIKSLLGSTSSPISVLNISSADKASSAETLSITLFSGSIVVSHN